MYFICQKFTFFPSIFLDSKSCILNLWYFDDFKAIFTKKFTSICHFEVKWRKKNGYNYLTSSSELLNLIKLSIHTETAPPNKIAPSELKKPQQQFPNRSSLNPSAAASLDPFQVNNKLTNQIKTEPTQQPDGQFTNNTDGNGPLTNVLNLQQQQQQQTSTGGFVRNNSNVFNNNIAASGGGDGMNSSNLVETNYIDQEVVVSTTTTTTAGDVNAITSHVELKQEIKSELANVKKEVMFDSTTIVKKESSDVITTATITKKEETTSSESQLAGTSSEPSSSATASAATTNADEPVTNSIGITYKGKFFKRIFYYYKPAKIKLFLNWNSLGKNKQMYFDNNSYF